MASGWGTTDSAAPWRGRGGVAASAEVSDGAARLSVGGVNGLYLDVPSYVTEFLAVGRFIDCTHLDDGVVLDVGVAISVSVNGSLRVGNGTPTSLEDFDPCLPWYLRMQVDDNQVAVKAWQATATEPAEAQASAPITGENRLEIDTFGVTGDPGREFVLDWLDFELAPWG